MNKRRIIIHSKYLKDKDFPYEDDEPSDYEMMSNFGTKWHDGL